MYDLEIKPEVDKIFSKLAKKNPHQLMVIDKKIQDIRKTPLGYKFLRKPLSRFNRMHVDKHFVLIFQIYHDRKIVEIYYFGHHDSVFDWQPK